MRDRCEKDGERDTLVSVADASPRGRKLRYERPTLQAFGEKEILEWIGPAQGYGQIDFNCDGSLLC